MHVAHSRAIAAAVVALSTCAGASHVALGRDHTAPREVAVVAAAHTAVADSASAVARPAAPATLE